MSAPVPLVKTVQTVKKTYLCPLCGRAYPSHQDYEEHAKECPGKGLELGRMYLGTRMMRQDRDGNIFVFTITTVNYAVVSGQLFILNMRTPSVSFNTMTSTTEELRDWHMVTDDEAFDTVKNALMGISDRIISLLRGGSA